MVDIDSSHGVMEPAAALPVSGFVSSLDLGDFDGDLDILVGTTSRLVHVLLGDGSGSFSNSGSIATGGIPTSSLVGDFNSDGHPDLAVTTELGRIPIFLSKCGLGLSVIQIGGPGSGLTVQNSGMTPGLEYFNLFSADTCPTGPGTGPSNLFGLCVYTPANAQAVVDQIMLPVGAVPFHFIAAQDSATWGPYTWPGPTGLTLEGVCLEIQNRGISASSPVATITIQ